MKGSNYHEEMIIHNNKSLRFIISSLPPFAFEFFRGIEQTTSSKTRIAYAYDLRIFFEFLAEFHDEFKDVPCKDITIAHLDLITADHLEMFLEYLSYYISKDGLTEHTNKNQSKSRKMATLRIFYKYFFRKQKIKTNPTVFVDLPKVHDKVITRLEIDEVAKLLDEVESGEHLTKRQKAYHSLTKDRDLALLTLLLGTGIRVSECVGLNITDVDLNLSGIRIVRKGGTEVIIYFGSEVEEALLMYLEKRKKKIPESGHEDALFLSLQNKRLSVRSIQNLVKKYAKLVTKLKNISPHKLRSTYGTNLYRETGDIYIVADVLGHKDVNTTKKHYAEIEDERRRKAAKSVRLRT